MEEQAEGCGDAEVPKGHPGGVSGLELGCPGLEVRLGVGEMQGGSSGEHEQLGARGGEGTTVRGWVQCPQSYRDRKFGGQ